MSTIRVPPKPVRIGDNPLRLSFYFADNAGIASVWIPTMLSTSNSAASLRPVPPTFLRWRRKGGQAQNLARTLNFLSHRD